MLGHRLYRWILELYDFPESQLRKDLKKYDINSVMWVSGGSLLSGAVWQHEDTG